MSTKSESSDFSWNVIFKEVKPLFYKCTLSPFSFIEYVPQGLSQDLETGCLKLTIVKFWGVQILSGTTIY